MVDSVMVDATTKTLGNENNDAKQSKWDRFIDVLKYAFYFLANINVHVSTRSIQIEFSVDNRLLHA